MWRAIAALIVDLLKWLVSESIPTAEDGLEPGELEKRLKRKLRRDGWL